MKKAKWELKFYLCDKFRWLNYYSNIHLRWKDKYGTPRCENVPHFYFEWLWFGMYGSKGDDQYWEQWLWVNKYYHGNVEQARLEWGWIDSHTKKTTWIDY